MLSSNVAAMSTSAMRASTRFLRLTYFSRSCVGQKFTNWTACVHAADTVNAAEPLDDPDWIPVDVVIDEEIAVLEVLALGDAIGGDKQVNFLRLRHGRHFVAVFGARGEVGEDLVEIGLAECGVVIATAGDQRNMDAQVLPRPGRQLLEQVCRGIGKGGEDEHLPVGLAELVGGGVFGLALDEALEFLELGVAFGGDILG